jgi:hypothetical protein
MGRDARCIGEFKGQSGEGRLQLEATGLLFRGPFRLSIPIKSITQAEAVDGALRVRFSGGSATFAIGKSAEGWAKEIVQPKSLLDKLGIKPGQRVALVGVEDAGFQKELEARRAVISGPTAGEIDHLFFLVWQESDLKRVKTLRKRLCSNGALWVLRPKGAGGVSESATMAAGKEAGLVDVKVVAFSATHSAEKFVIPLTHRGRS